MALPALRALNKRKPFGILKCDVIHERYLKQGVSPIDIQFTRFLQSVDKNIVVNNYNVIDNEYPSDMDECFAYIVTGSKFSVYDDIEWIKNLRRYVSDLLSNKKKVMGICFGHQLIGDVLEGGRTERSDKGWGIGVHQYRIIKEFPWMEPRLNTMCTFASHQDQVVAVPTIPNVTVFAENDHCPNAGLVIEDYCITFQGHPEWERITMALLLEYRTNVEKRIDPALAERAFKTLDNETHGNIFAKWVLNFFKYPKDIE